MQAGRSAGHGPAPGVLRPTFPAPRCGARAAVGPPDTEIQEMRGGGLGDFLCLFLQLSCILVFHLEPLAGERSQELFSGKCF